MNRFSLKGNVRKLGCLLQNSNLSTCVFSIFCLKKVQWGGYKVNSRLVLFLSLYKSQHKMNTDKAFTCLKT